jgi:hypothetical protein
MKRLADTVVLLAVVSMFAVSLALFRRAFSLTSPWFGLMVMLTFLGLIAFARPLIRLRLPKFLRTEREWEMNGRLYKALRVPTFGALLRRSALRHLNPLVYLKQDSDRSIVEAQIEAAEAAHFLAGGLLVPYILYACARGWWAAVAWLMVVQIGGNLYPILHLRWVRVRIGRLRYKAASGQMALETDNMGRLNDFRS